jgi:hypothetical protein
MYYRIVRNEFRARFNIPGLLALFPDLEPLRDFSRKIEFRVSSKKNPDLLFKQAKINISGGSRKPVRSVGSRENFLHPCGS